MPHDSESEGVGGGLSRREFVKTSAVLTSALAANWGLGLAAGTASLETLEEVDMARGAKELVLQPVFMYSLPERREARSWRHWGGIETQIQADQEAARVEKEVAELCAAAQFAVRALPLVHVTSVEGAGALAATEADVLLVYAAGGWTEILETLAKLGKWLVIFVRYKSGPYYLWHEIVHARFLRSHTDHLMQAGVDFGDVVVDDVQELRWRLGALYALKNTLGRSVVCIGGPGGWSCPQAPERARERFDLNLVTVPVPDLEGMIASARKDKGATTRAQKAAAKYVQQTGAKLETSRDAVAESFLLADIFLGLLRQHDAWAITVKGCMGSYARIMPCLTLGLLNDAGLMAYCESDFVVIPSGILLHFISGKPTFLCNPTYPRGRKMLFAHCHSPRRMDGKRLEPVRIVTHFESDHGAAPKVEFRHGQTLTVIKPDFEAKRWLVLTARIADTPFLPVCRSQIEAEFDVGAEQILPRMRGFHSMIAYGDYRREVVYGAKKVGIEVDQPV